MLIRNKEKTEGIELLTQENFYGKHSEKYLGILEADILNKKDIKYQVRKILETKHYNRNLKKYYEVLWTLLKLGRKGNKVEL